MRIIADIITPPCSLIGVWSDVMRATSQTNQLWPRRVVCSPAVQMNFTVTDRTQMTAVYSNSHHWNIMQTAPGRFKYVVSGESLLQRFNTCVFLSGRVFFRVSLQDSGSPLVLHLVKMLCVTEAENRHANPVIWPRFSRSWASAINIFTIYGHMLYILCHRPKIPPILCRLIFCVSELWIVVPPLASL